MTRIHVVISRETGRGTIVTETEDQTITRHVQALNLDVNDATVTVELIPVAK